MTFVIMEKRKRIKENPENFITRGGKFSPFLEYYFLHPRTSSAIAETIVTVFKIGRERNETRRRSVTLAKYLLSHFLLLVATILSK